MFEEMANTLVENLTGMTMDQIKAQMIVVQRQVLETIQMINDNFKTIALKLDQITTKVYNADEAQLVRDHNLNQRLNVHSTALEQICKRLDGSKTGLLAAQLEKIHSEVVQIGHDSEVSKANSYPISEKVDRVSQQLEIVLDHLDGLNTNDHMIMAEQANTLTHIAQISFKLGLDLTPDLVSQLTKAATNGRSSTFDIPPVSSLPDPGEPRVPVLEPVPPFKNFEPFEAGLDGIGKVSPTLPNPGDSQTVHETNAGDVLHATGRTDDPTTA